MANNRKRAMPAKLREKGKAAVDRHQRRPIAPEVEITAKEGTWSYGSPYKASDDLAWCALVFEAFGTRQQCVANMFVSHLAQLCSSQWDDDARAWRPDEDELQSAIALVQSLAPRNEAEAALAAQAVAVHFATMKLARSLAVRSSPDARSMASLAALAKTYAHQLEAMQKLRGKKTSRQRITVSYERHNHNHQHVHFEGGGGPNSGGQAQATDTRKFKPSAALPSNDAAGSLVPLPGSQGQARLPNARGRKRIGGATREG